MSERAMTVLPAGDGPKGGTAANRPQQTSTSSRESVPSMASTFCRRQNHRKNQLEDPEKTGFAGSKAEDLSLRELGSTAGAAEAVLLPLFHAAIPGEEATLPQRFCQFGIEGLEGPGNP